MTLNAAQLIEKLSKLDPETLITVETCDNEVGTTLEEVTDIHDVSFVAKNIGGFAFAYPYAIVNGTRLDNSISREVDLDNPPKVAALAILTF